MMKTNDGVQLITVILKQLRNTVSKNVKYKPELSNFWHLPSLKKRFSLMNFMA